MTDVDIDRDEWVTTDHERVFYESTSDRFGRGEQLLGEFVAEHLPGWDVLLTMGPYRTHDIRYELHPEDRVIHLDIYSAGVVVTGTEYRPENPLSDHAESLIHDIARGIKESDADFDLREELGVDEDE